MRRSPCHSRHAWSISAIRTRVRRSRSASRKVPAPFSASSAVTNSSGYASVNLTLTNFTTSFQISVCVANGNPCQPIYGNAVAASMLNLQAVAGESQVVSGTVFQPLEIRVIDSSTPPNPILGANVLFQSTVSRPLGDDSILLQKRPSEPR